MRPSAKEYVKTIQSMASRLALISEDMDEKEIISEISSVQSGISQIKQSCQDMTFPSAISRVESTISALMAMQQDNNPDLDLVIPLMEQAVKDLSFIKNKANEVGEHVKRLQSNIVGDSSQG